MDVPGYSRPTENTSSRGKSSQPPLRPRALVEKSRARRLTIKIVIPTILSILLIFGFSLGGIMTSDSSWSSHLSGHFSYYSTDVAKSECDMMTSNGLVSIFLIDLRVVQSLSYAQARIIDISWDIVVGQGGRILHAWILYRYVLAPNLSRIMERKAVPISAYIDLIFKGPSLTTLTTLIMSFWQFKGPRAVISAIFGIFAIAYVLAFAPIWNATSGYLSPSGAVWQMDDHTLVSVNDPSPLTYCWIHNDSRLDGIVPRVVNSPPIDGKLMANLGDELGAQIRFDMENFVNGDFFRRVQATNPGDSSKGNVNQETTAFVDIFNYLVTAQLLSDNHHGTENSAWSWMYSTPHLLNTSTQFNSSFGTLDYPAVDAGGKQVSGYGWLANFVCEGSVTRTHCNSSLVYNGSVHALQPPFVSFGEGCKNSVYGSYFLSRLCLCYKGEPIAHPLSDTVSCLSQDGYVWGFNTLFTGIGVILESVWILGCMAAWLDAYKNGRLMRLQRVGGGPVRSAYDLVEATRDYIGPDHTAYSDKELRRAVETRNYVAYELNDSKWETQVRLTTRIKKRK